MLIGPDNSQKGNISNAEKNDKLLMQDSENQELLKKAKMIECKRKLKGIASNSTEQKKIYIFGIIILIAFYLAVFGIFIAIRLKYLKKMNSLITIADAVIYTLPIINYMLTITLEDFISMNILHVNFWEKQISEFDRIYDHLRNNINIRESVEADAETQFKELAESLDYINSNEVCNITTYYENAFVTCDQAYNRILAYGLENCFNKISIEIRTIHGYFVNALANNNTEYASSFSNSIDFNELLDINTIFLVIIDLAFTDIVIGHGKELIKSVKKFELIDFIVDRKSVV